MVKILHLGSNCQGCIFNDVTFVNTVCNKADFSNSTFERSEMPRHMNNVNLSGVSLHNKDLNNVFLSRANLTNTNLSGCNLSSADLSYADVRGCVMASTIVSGANMIGVNRDSALWQYLPRKYSFGRLRRKYCDCLCVFN